MKKILIIEDDINLQEGLEIALRTEYFITRTSTVKRGLECIKSEVFDGIILDCNLPDGSGFELCKEVRKFSDIPILMLTARNAEMDEVKALEMGMDDYMSKPFSLSVLKARLKKIIKKSEETVRIMSNGFVIDKNACKVWKNEIEIVCSAIEYKLILYLVENKNKVLSKEQILYYIWDNNGKFVDGNVVSVNICRLREKIEENPSQPIFIHTIYGMGYMWKEE